MADSEQTINTGGGASVGKDAHAGRDFVGRDQINFFVPLGNWNEIRELLFSGRPQTAAGQTEAQFQTFDWAKAERAYLDKLVVLYDRVRILGTAGDVPLGNIFTQVYILDKPTAYRRYNIDELLKQGFERTALQGQPGERIPGIELVKGGQNLFILGKPGAGKTTFLKYITLQAAAKHLPLIPIFVSLNEWADSRWGKVENVALVPFIVEQFAICGFPDGERFINFLLTTGRALLLFDGLDEVKQEQAQRRRLTRLLQDFARQYDRCQHLITCRIAASDYTFAGFAHVEVADFTPAQVTEYARHWFGEDEKKFAAFTAELARPENRGLAELANTPLLLSLLCLTFDNAMRFPPNRAELYEDALDALLRKWDSSRQIQRDEIYRALSPKRKRHLLTSIAVPTFEKGELFFRQRDVEGWIVDYLARLPDAPPADTIDGAAILKAMEAQHSILVERAQGIYSFSHLTFQEYLTASYLVENQGRGVTERLIVSHLTDRRWREVILLTASLLGDADELVAAMRAACDGRLADAPRLVELLDWAEGKTIAAQMRREQRISVRASYLFLGLSINVDLLYVRELERDIGNGADIAFRRISDLGTTLDIGLNGTPFLARDLPVACEVTPFVGLDYKLYCAWAYAAVLAVKETHSYGSHNDHWRWKESVQELVQGVIQLADEVGLVGVAGHLAGILIPAYPADWQDWKACADALFAILAKERDMGHRWELSREEGGTVIGDYLYANELLFHCLQVAAVSDRQTILQGLLLPPKD